MKCVRFAARVALGAGLCTLTACGGSSTSGLDAPGSFDGGGAPAATYTLDDVCERTAPSICALRKPCCAKTTTYDEAGCLAHTKASCAKDVADARAGSATFHPERIDGCLAKLAPLYESCAVTFDVLAKVSKVLAECAVFEGKLPVGAPCERNAQCAPSTTPSTVTSCSDAKVCRATTFLQAGDACAFGDGNAALCDESLFCDADLTKKPPSGTCKKATAVGQPCDAGKVLDLQCGLGNYCDRATALCAKGKGANAACTADVECASFTCESGVAGRVCAPPASIVKPEECKGP